MTEWIEWIIAAVAAPVLTLLLHELSHYFVLKGRGATILSFKPWPHTWNGQVYLGMVRWIMANHDAYHRRTTVAISAVAPLLKSTILCVTYWSTSYYWAPLAVFAAFEGLDTLYWAHGYFFDRPNSDGLKWKKRKHGV